MTRLPTMAAWRHVGSREGFEVTFPRREHDSLRFDGYSVGIQEGEPWAVRYTLTLDERWVTRTALVVARSSSGDHQIRLESDGQGRWKTDGESMPELTGVLDVDLEASALTNALPVHRLGLSVGGRSDAPAVYVRSCPLRVERLDQVYARLPDSGEFKRYDYEAPAFDFSATLTYDDCGLILDYPQIATRVA